MTDWTRPLADRMRPRLLAEFVGQPHLLGAGKPLRQAIEAGRPHSMVLWGPPGTGKTTLAQIIAATADAEFLALSAVMAGVKEIRQASATGRANQARGRRTIVFVDEVHRFNKAQQDAFLPYIEDGTVIFIGATTENPSFELNNALLSRARTYVLRPLDEAELGRLIDWALEDNERGLGAKRLVLTDEARSLLVQVADGDARIALSLLEVAADLGAAAERIDIDLIRGAAAGGHARFDKRGEAFYDQISALHKAIRGSAPDAALYWLCRMLAGGCDPLYIVRRLLRMASEDIGNADPRALQIALNAWDTQERLGSPEGELAIAHAVVYLASVPKSNAVYRAYQAAAEAARRYGSLEVPLALRNAPTRLLRELGYGRGYRYAHDEPEGYAAGVDYFPAELAGTRYYHPTDRGLERKLAEHLARLRALDRKAHAKDGN
ncbi:MAG TPA: replication-associated recombination protein A [Nitrococcus sp.]|nr:replication-associated recombination protein A [Nitrococcus sp.]